MLMKLWIYMNMDSETQTKSTTDNDFPVAAIICIAIGGWICIIVIILLIRSCLVHKGWCAEQCQCCGKEGQPQCCACWINCAESCNCCGSPSIDSCLDSICPRRKQMDCADIIMCQCCAGSDCCNSSEPLCDCGQCNCNCQCQPPECNDVNCFCFKLESKDPVPQNTGYGGGYGGYGTGQGGYGTAQGGYGTGQGGYGTGQGGYGTGAYGGGAYPS